MTTATQRPTGKSASSAPGALRVTPAKRVVTREPRRLYWCGLLSGAEVDGVRPFPGGGITVGGVTFQAAQDTLEASASNPRMKVPAGKTPGLTMELTRAQVDRVLKRVAQGVVRPLRKRNGEITRFHRACADDPRYRPEPGDLPIGLFLYMLKLGPGGVRPERVLPMVRDEAASETETEKQTANAE